MKANCQKQRCLALLDPQHQRNSVENKPESLLVVSLGFSLS